MDQDPSLERVGEKIHFRWDNDRVYTRFIYDAISGAKLSLSAPANISIKHESIYTLRVSEKEHIAESLQKISSIPVGEMFILRKIALQ